MFLGFCFKGFHWPTIIVIMAEGKEDKMRGGGGGDGGLLRNNFKGGYTGEGKEDKMQGGCCEKKLRGGGVVAKEI